MDYFMSETSLAGTKLASNKAKRKGEINFRHVAILNAIKNIIDHACNIGATEEELRSLNIIYYNFYSSSKDLPFVERRSDDVFKSNNMKKLEVQTSDDPGLNPPEVGNYSIS